MGEMPRQNLRPADLRRLIADMVAKGCTVDLRPDGSMRIIPATTKPSDDPFDTVDLRR